MAQFFFCFRDVVFYFRHIKGILFCVVGVPFWPKVVYMRVRVWFSGTILFQALSQW